MSDANYRRLPETALPSFHRRGATAIFELKTLNRKRLGGEDPQIDGNFFQTYRDKLTPVFTPVFTRSTCDKRQMSASYGASSVGLMLSFYLSPVFTRRT